MRLWLNFLCVILWVYPDVIASQNKNPSIDSLIIIATNVKTDDTARVRLLSQIGLIKPDYRLEYWDSISEICIKALTNTTNFDEIEKLTWSYAGALNNMGFIQNNYGNVDSATALFLESIKLKKSINDDKGVAQTYNNLGVILDTQGRIQEALNYHQKSLIIRLKIEDEQGQAESLNNLAYIYLYQEDTIKAEEFFHRSLELHNKTDNQVGIANVKCNLSHISRNKGESIKSRSLYRAAFKSYLAEGDDWGVGLCYHYIGLTFSDELNSDSAIVYFNKALTVQLELNDPRGACFSYVSLANEELKINNHEKANEYAELAHVIALELSLPELLKASSKILYKIKKDNGNFKSALSFYELYIEMRDSIKNTVTQKATIRQQTKYDFEKAQLVKEQELKDKARVEAETTRRRDNLQYSIIFVGILVLFGVVLSLGFLTIPIWLAEGLIFFAFLLLFEFLLVLTDPYVDSLTNGEPMYKLLLNAVLAALIFPLHSFFERLLKNRLVKNKSK